MAAAVAAFKALLGPLGWSEDPAVLAPHLRDWRGRYTGSTAIMLMPNTTIQAAEIVKIASQYVIPLVPQGGNTGLVGGATPDTSGGQVLISMSRMNAIRSLSTDDDSLVAEAGVILAHVQQAATTANRYFPLSLASEGSAQIGGLIATNAGGVHVLRYGSMRALVLGLEAVLPDGSILNGLSSLRKDNSGYDLKQLLIGSEGTLAIITAATLKLFAQPRVSATALLGLSSVDQALGVLSQLQADSGGALCAFELMPRLALDLVLKHLPQNRDPFQQVHSWYVLAELNTSAADVPVAAMLEASLATALKGGMITGAVVANSEAQRAALWALREAIPEAEKREGVAIKHDVSVPVAAMPGFMVVATKALELRYPGTHVLAFGHLGDGNVHFNLMPAPGADGPSFLALTQEVNAHVYAMVLAAGGSISAEHGIGRLKKTALASTADPAKLAAMQSIKRALDPKNILNPRIILDL